MLGIILVAVLILALLGVLPRWTHSRNWRYYPTGGVGVILFVVVILLILGRIRTGLPTACYLGRWRYGAPSSGVFATTHSASGIH